MYNLKNKSAAGQSWISTWQPLEWECNFTAGVQLVHGVVVWPVLPVKATPLLCTDSVIVWGMGLTGPVEVFWLAGAGVTHSCCVLIGRRCGGRVWRRWAACPGCCVCCCSRCVCVTCVRRSSLSWRRSSRSSCSTHTCATTWWPTHRCCSTSYRSSRYTHTLSSAAIWQAMHLWRDAISSQSC